MRAVTVLVPALLLALAGCFSPPDVGGPAALPSPLDPFLVQHDHWDASAHALAWNVRELAWDALASPGARPGAHSVDLHGDLLAVGTAGESASLTGGVNRPSETNGFVLVDVADPAAPRVLGKYHTDSPLSADRTVVFSADGKTVFVGGLGEVIAVDVSDPAAPAEAARFPNPRDGAHTVFAAEVDGTQFVYVIGNGLLTFSYDAAKKEFTLLSRYITATPEGLLDTPLGPDGATYARRDVYGHDVFAEKDPVTGRHLAYVAYAYEGVKIVDLSNPRLPVEVATWRASGEGAPWYTHTIWVAHLEGRRVAVVGTEVFENRHLTTPSPVWVLDLTELESPKLLATWTNPGGKGSDNLLFSAHDLRITPEGLVALSHYHGGVWVLDLRDLAAVEAAGTVPNLGYILPHRDNGWRPEGPCCFNLNFGGIPATMDVVMRGNHLFAADFHTGFYAFEYVPS